MVTHARTRAPTVLVYGATGRLTALTPRLLSRGHQVLAATRGPASAAARRLRVEAIQTDIQDGSCPGKPRVIRPVV